MTVLIDTHFLIWMIEAPHRIRPTERAILMDNAASIRISAVSLWEIRIKWQSRDRSGNRKGSIDPVTALRFCTEQGWQPAPLTADDSLVRLDPPMAHRDPFDEMLLVHARQLGARLMTRDRLLRNHPLALSA